MRIPPLTLKILLVSNPPKSIILVRRLAVTSRENTPSAVRTSGCTPPRHAECLRLSRVRSSAYIYIYIYIYMYVSLSLYIYIYTYMLCVYIYIYTYYVYIYIYTYIYVFETRVSNPRDVARLDLATPHVDLSGLY